jgi:3'-phosphoadenosine 5'-phosphosulfate sulfotransferase (PAPS reductase)/FAD synthetase
MADKVRHILGLSGGKDSAALAILMYKDIPNMEYFFCDTKKELPETYDFLDRIKARLGIKIEYLSSERGFDHWLNVNGGFLPSPQARWCTKQLKIVPLEQFIGEDQAVSYVGIRADENRSGYISTKPNIKAVFPFKERGIDKAGVTRILEESGIGMPKYYSWRSRSGCFFCFYQRKYEWVKLSEEHPGLFKEAMKYEEEHKDGRKFTWSQGETLQELIARKDKILADHDKEIQKKKEVKPNQPLHLILEKVLDEENEDQGCVTCHV